MKEKILIVCGPTASGKTALAVDIARKYNGEVISADSVAVYKNLDIGSAKPDEKEMQGIPHYMINVADDTAEFSVSDYENQALKIIYDILSRDKLPIICGGTGFYVNSLIYKMSYGNAKGDLNLRKKYEEIAEKHGNLAVWNELNKIDEQTAKKLHPNDLVRVIRAIEIFYSTGIKKSEVVDELIPRFDYFAIMPENPREKLYERINSRVDNMLEKGLVNEVKGLIAKGITLNNQCMQGIGYKEIYPAVINGEEIPVEEIKRNSRRYAKRQLTFFKRINPYKYDAETDENKSKLYSKIDEFLEKTQNDE